MQTWLFVAAGGAIGACLRFGIAELMALLLGRHFPYGTLMVNLIGSFIMGVAYALILHGHIAEHPMKPLLMVGILGALTTFSSFALDTVALAQHGRLSQGAAQHRPQPVSLSGHGGAGDAVGRQPGLRCPHAIGSGKLAAILCSMGV